MALSRMTVRLIERLSDGYLDTAANEFDLSQAPRDSQMNRLLALITGATMAETLAYVGKQSQKAVVAGDRAVHFWGAYKAQVEALRDRVPGIAAGDDEQFVYQRLVREFTQHLFAAYQLKNGGGTR